MKVTKKTSSERGRRQNKRDDYLLMERLFIFNCSQLDGCMHIFIYIYTQTHTHAQTYFVFKSSYLGFEEKKNIKNKLINKLKSWTIHSVGFRVDQTVS